MSGRVQHLHPVVPAPDDPPVGAGADHPMRKVTRQVAFEPEGWDAARRAKVAGLFNDLAPEWHTRLSEERLEVVYDALDRGGLTGGPGTVCVEVGSGTGFATPLLDDRFDQVLAVDVAIEMLRRAPADAGHRILADAATLPVADGSVDAVVLVNALLFPREVDRVLRPGGAVVWVSSLGDRTPIYLSATDVAAALPGSWTGVSSSAGWGTWSVHRRG